MDYIQPITHQSQQPNRKEIEMKNQYVIVVTYDSCDPIIYGIFKSENEAKKAEKKILKRFTDYDWRHQDSVTIEKITTVK